MAIKYIPAGELIEDLTLYPRRKISDHNISELTEALRAGVTLPPLVADEKHRLIDGLHRRAAYERVFGPGHKVAVDVRSFDNDAEAFLEAVKLNSTHGQKLIRADEIRCVTHAGEMGLSDLDIAAALNVTADRVQKLKIRVVIHETTHEALPSKIVVRHLEGKMITASQAKALDRGPGIAPLRLINDLIAWLDTGLLDTTDERITAALERLRKAIAGRLDQAA